MKNFTNENQALKDELMALLGLCYEISTTTKHDVFFGYPPHVDGFEVYMYENGFKHNNKPIWITDVNEPIWITGVGHDKITLENIEKCKEKLLKYKGDK